MYALMDCADNTRKEWAWERFYCLITARRQIVLDFLLGLLFVFDFRGALIPILIT